MEWRTEPRQLDLFLEGYHCAILRNDDTLFLCGYVAIPSSHPYFKLEYPDIDCHGGVTYCQMGLREIDPKMTDWWIGFDCGHGGDKIPMLDELLIKHPTIFNGHKFSEGTYKNINYVEMELLRIVDQLIDAEDYLREY